MSIVTCTAKTRNDLSVARIVVEVLAQSWGYKCSVTYNDGKSFDIMVPAGAEDNAIQKFKKLCPNLDIFKSDKKVMATAQTESRRKMREEVDNNGFESVSAYEGDMWNKEGVGEVFCDADCWLATSEDGENSKEFDTKEEAEDWLLSL